MRTRLFLIALLTPAAALAAGPAGGAAIDSNADGRITRAEWIAAGRKDEGFTMADTNADDIIDTAEMQALQARMTPANMSAAAMARMDADTSGAISRAEWLAAGRRERGFDFADSNADGQVSAAELEAAMAKAKTMRRR